TVDGGTGASLDCLSFTTAGTVAATAFANVSHIEQLILSSSGDRIAPGDALVGSSDANRTLYIYGGTGDDTISGWAVTTAINNLYIAAGTGNDTLTGGAGADTFVFLLGTLDANDHVDGGTGTSVDMLDFTGHGTVAAAQLANVSHIEKIAFGSTGT